MGASIKTFHKKTIFYLAVLSVFYMNLLSCSARVDKDDEIKTIWKVIEAKIPKWIEHSRKIDPGFDINNFYLDWVRDLKPIDEWTFTQEEHKRLDSIYYYIYSPDSTKYLDIYSAFAELDTVNGFVEAMFQPDVGAVLVDRNNRKKSVFISYGTTGCLDDAVWINNESFIITGYVETTDTAPFLLSAQIHYINLKDKIHKRYISTRSLTRMPGYYGYKFPEFVKERHK